MKYFPHLGYMTEIQFGRNGARPDVGLDIGPKLAQLQRFQFFDFRALIPALQPGSCFANWLVDVLVRYQSRKYIALSGPVFLPAHSETDPSSHPARPLGHPSPGQLSASEAALHRPERSDKFPQNIT